MSKNAHLFLRVILLLWGN